MNDQFSFDVFLSHSSKDKAAVRAVAERLNADGMRVWLDDWEIHPGDSIHAKIEEGLESSRVLVLCMSANASGSDWAQLEACTYRFRDPLNKDRRFIPLRLDEAPVRGSLAQFLYINWLAKDREQEYTKLLEACRPPAAKSETASEQIAEHSSSLSARARIWDYAFSPDGRRVLSGALNHRVQLWDMETGRCVRVLEGHTEAVNCVALSPDQSLALSGGADNTVRLWEVQTGRCLRVLEGHAGSINDLSWGLDQSHALSASSDQTLRVWDVDTGRCERVLDGHTATVWSVVWSADRVRALSASGDGSVRVWDVDSGRCLRVFEGHASAVYCVAWRADKHLFLSGSADRTVGLWEVETGRRLRVLEGHTDIVSSVAWSTDGRYALSASHDKTVRLWNVETGLCLRVLEGHTDILARVAWSADRRSAFSGDSSGGIRVWDLSQLIMDVQTPHGSGLANWQVADQVQYTNAKVLLVGDSSAGKTGLSMRLASEDWRPSDSTVGAWATHWKVPVSSAGFIEREIWLWDFGGQADQRLIHQLYMEDTALAVLVFDGQKEDLLETLRQWDRDLMRSSRKAFNKLLVAGRVDAGGLRVSRAQIEAFAKERGFTDRLFETSAKVGTDCENLKQAILRAIRWENIPWRSSPLLFKRIKEHIIQLRGAGHVLMRFNELRDALHLRLAGQDASFTDEELNAVVGLLSGPGVVWELAFGSWVLLQPETINAYAQAVIQTLRTDEHEKGAIAEERVLRGDLVYQSSMRRLKAEDERFVLLAMHQMLVERGLCLREHTDTGPLLVFPSYYRRERPELVGHPAVLVSYRFNGFLDDIYSSLIVRLHHTKAFVGKQLWRNGADFRTLTERQLGVKLTRGAGGASELELYFDRDVAVEEKIIFSRYVHEHLLQRAQDVIRLRHYVCPHCGTRVGNSEVTKKKLAEGKKDVVCIECEKRVPLWDQMEALFADPETKQRVLDLQQQSAIVLDNESKERALVGEVISTVALAGQISREFNVSDHGIDMEIEFKNDDGEATGKKLYLQLKSGDSYLRQRQKDEAEVFTIKDERHGRYWAEQAFPVMLVIRTSEGEIRWMEIRDWLKHAKEECGDQVKQIVFDGARFDVMSVRRWRGRALGLTVP